MTPTHDDKARELLPCPFCAGADIFIEPDERGSGGQWVSPIHVGCAACKAEQIADDKEAAIDAWNRRAALSAARELPPLPEPLRHVWPETDDCCFPCHYTPSGPGGIYGPARADGLRSFPIYTAQQMQDYALSALSPASSTGQAELPEGFVRHPIEQVEWWAMAYAQQGGHALIVQMLDSYQALLTAGFAAPQQVAEAEIRDRVIEEAAEVAVQWDQFDIARAIRALKSAAGSNNGEGERG